MTALETILAVTSLAPIALLIAVVIQSAIGARVKRKRLRLVSPSLPDSRK
jgi:hypothetical protein